VPAVESAQIVFWVSKNVLVLAIDDVKMYLPVHFSHVRSDGLAMQPKF